MCSAFSSRPGFDSLLERLSTADSLQDSRFAARNFLLERHLPGARIEEYLDRSELPSATDDAQADFVAFTDFHDRYQAKELRKGARTVKFDMSSPDCPDTFRNGRSLEEFEGTDEELYLIRLEKISLIAEQTFTHEPLSSLPAHEATLNTLLTEVAAENRAGHLSSTRRQSCDRILQLWQDMMDNRPLYAAFWEDAESVVGDPEPNWALELRDRLGLAHYDPSMSLRSGIPVVLFRYPVKLIPRATPHGPRFLVRPTVLDGQLNEAFYTAPPDTGVGAAVDLVMRDDDPWQEVMHPAVEFRAEHVWATDLIRVGCSDKLPNARAYHCLKLCDRTTGDFVDLCQSIDGDLL